MYQIAELFGRDVKKTGKRINNALQEEFNRFSSVEKFATNQIEGKRKVEGNSGSNCPPLFREFLPPLETEITVVIDSLQAENI